MELKGRYPENLYGPQRETHITYIYISIGFCLVCGVYFGWLWLIK